MTFHLDGRYELDDDYRSKLSPLADINMTPFVDVCLVLLIIFMVTAPFAISGVNVQLPKTQTKQLTLSNESLILSITKDGSFFLGKSPITELDLVTKIKQSLPSQEKSALFIRADVDVPYGKIMVAMVAAQRAGVEKIGMLGENKNEKK